MPLLLGSEEHTSELQSPCNLVCRLLLEKQKSALDRKSTRLNSSHLVISYAVFCLKTIPQTLNPTTQQHCTDYPVARALDYLASLGWVPTGAHRGAHGGRPRKPENFFFTERTPTRSSLLPPPGPPRT